MYKTIIATLGLSHGHGARALEAARKLLDDDGRIVAVHVLEPVPGFAKNYLPPDHEEQARAGAELAMSERVGDAKDAELVILSGYPGRAITEYAEKIGADCIIVGSHKPDLQDFLLGSTAARVVRHAPCSVHVLR